MLVFGLQLQPASFAFNLEDLKQRDFVTIAVSRSAQSRFELISFPGHSRADTTSHWECGATLLAQGHK